MRTISLVVLASWLICGSALRAAEPTTVPELKIGRALENMQFERPIFLTGANDGTNRLFVVEQAGRILWFSDERRGDEPVLAIDIREKVHSPANGGHNEEGLLGFAFHPDFKNNRQVFLHYSAMGQRRNVLSRFSMDEQRRTIIPESEEVILQVPQPYGNHNGGMIAFGPDGYLYIALGDGGAGGDPHGNGQNLATLLGAILRIDVNRPAQPASAGGPAETYAIPPDNPFVNRRSARPEIYAYGLRNVWRFSFDRKTGDLWAGDVGQDKIEEIDLIIKGGNYGWNLREGSQPYTAAGVNAIPNWIDPIVEHSHNEAKSITGGYVYRGERIPALDGAYIYGDYVTGLIWALRYDPQTQQRRGPHVIGHVPEIASFGEDADGEIYVVSLEGRIYKLMPGD